MENIEKIEKVEKSTKIKISLDTKVSDIVEYDQDGKTLFFDSTPGRFVELSEDIIRKLSAKNRESYLFALKSNVDETKQQRALPSENLDIIPEYAMAQTRLNVQTTPEFDRIYHLCWKRPDELQIALAEGYTFASPSDGLTSFGNLGEKGRIICGTAGHVELYLMKIPQEKAMARIRYVEKLSKDRDNKVMEAAKDKLEQLGGQPFEAQRDENQWKNLGGG